MSLLLAFYYFRDNYDELNHINPNWLQFAIKEAKYIGVELDPRIMTMFACGMLLGKTFDKKSKGNFSDGIENTFNLININYEYNHPLFYYSHLVPIGVMSQKDISLFLFRIEKYFCSTAFSLLCTILEKYPDYFILFDHNGDLFASDKQTNVIDKILFKRNGKTKIVKK
jgi:hypothetical protein